MLMRLKTTRTRRYLLPNGNRRAQAFSLLELVMVLLIMAVLAGIAAPRFASAAANNRARAAADRIAADLELAREQARATSASCSVAFSTTTESYTIKSANDAVAVDISRSPYESGIDSADFAGRPVFSFNAFGVPDTSGTIVVSGGGQTFTVAVAAGTGEVSIR